MKLTATWAGDLPALGDYLRAARGRFAYRIDGALVSTEGTIDRGEIVQMTRRVTFYVERIAAPDVPAGARVHLWSWTARNPKPRTPRRS